MIVYLFRLVPVAAVTPPNCLNGDLLFASSLPPINVIYCCNTLTAGRR